MILADTSIWLDHLRKGDPDLVELLGRRQILIHPFVVGELALGTLHQRKIVIPAMQNLPQAMVPESGEVLHFVERRALFGQGIGYVDAHLLAAVALAPGTLLWTRDKRLRAVSARLGFDAKLH